MLKIVCDRCYTERPLQISASCNDGSFQNMAMGRSATAFPVLGEWKEVQGKHLCSACIKKLAKFLEPVTVQE